MARFRAPQNAFVNGEISALAHGRTNIQEYAQGLSVMENALNLAQGGATKRPGFQQVLSSFDISGAGAEHLTKDVICIPFNYSDDEKYVIVMDSTVGMYAYNLDTLVRVSVPAKSAGTGTTGMKVLGSASTFRDGHKYHYAHKGNLMFIAHKDHIPVVLRRTALNTIEYAQFYNQDINVSNTMAVEKWPFIDGNLDQTHTMYLSSVAVGSRTITSSAAFFDDGHIGSPMYFGFGGSPAGWGTITAVASSTVATINVVQALNAAYLVATKHWEWYESAWSDYRGWPRTVALHEGRVFYGGTDSEPGKLWSTQAEDLFELTTEAVDITGATTRLNTHPFAFTLSGAKLSQIQWLLGGTTLRLGTSFEEHILEGSDKDVIMGSLNLPGGSFATATGSLSAMPAAHQSSVLFIQRNGLRIREFIFNRDVDNFQTNDVTVLAEQIPKRSDGIYSDGLDPKVAQIAIQSHDSPTVWCADNNGSLFSGTVDRGNGIIAWQKHILGGNHAINYGRITGVTATSPAVITFAAGHGMSDGESVVIGDSTATIPTIKGTHVLTHISGDDFSVPVDVTSLAAGALSLWSSVAVDLEPRVTSLFSIPSTDNTNDDIYIAVRRTYSGINRTTLEKITKRFDGGILNEQSTDIIKKPIYLDGAIMSQVASFPNGTASLTHSGFDVYNDAVVNVLADGKHVGEKTVSSAGVITLDDVAQEVIAGIVFSMKIETLPFDVGSVLGTAFMAVQRIEKVLIKLFKTAYLKIGQDFINMDEVEFADVNVDQSLPIALYTGVKELDFPGDYDREATVCLESDVPYPCTVSGMVMEGLTYDD